MDEWGVPLISGHLHIYIYISGRIVDMTIWSGYYMTVGTAIMLLSGKILNPMLWGEDFWGLHWYDGFFRMGWSCWWFVFQGDDHIEGWTLTQHYPKPLDIIQTCIFVCLSQKNKSWEDFWAQDSCHSGCIILQLWPGRKIPGSDRKGSICYGPNLPSKIAGSFRKTPSRYWKTVDLSAMNPKVLGNISQSDLSIGSHIVQIGPGRFYMFIYIYILYWDNRRYMEIWLDAWNSNGDV